jgi:hypothetical protein
VIDDLPVAAPYGGVMVLIPVNSGWPWIIAALGIVIVILGGLLLI